MSSKFSNWILIVLLVICVTVPIVRVQAAEWQYSEDPKDYNFGWIANGTRSNGSVPVCTYCVNVKTDGTAQADVTYWNRTVGLYRCDGVQYNEKWAYHEPTNAIVFNNLTGGALCLDSATLSRHDVLTLQRCNSSSDSQRWIWRGSTLVNGNSSVDGRSLTLTGGLPSPQKTSFSQGYSYPLTLNRSVSSMASDGSYTVNFTFLSQKTLVDDSTRRFTTKGLLAMNGGRLLNGNFESSTIQTGWSLTWSDWVQLQPSYLSVCGWVIEEGPIAYVKAGSIPPQDGQYSIHLNTFTDQPYWGSISQTIETQAAKDYRLMFYMSGFPPNFTVDSNQQWKCSSFYRQAKVQVQVSDGTGAVELTRNFSVGVRGYRLFIPWELQTVNFRPLTNVTKVLFKSLNFNDSCGPMIDSVSFFRPSPPKHTLLWALLGGIGGAALLLIFILGIVGFVVKKRYAKAKSEYADLLKTESAKVYSVKQLSAATNKFSSVLGEGAFGTVYKAVFPDGTIRAVKVEKSKSLNLSAEAAAKASEEITLLLRIHHRNLVNLTGFCINKGRQTLVFEYLSNGSLHDRLHQSVLERPSGRHSGSLSGDSDHEDLSIRYAKVLPWETRVKIACEVAYGLEYLHHDADPPIVHRDVKSHNILLTSSDSAKLADFGLSKSAPEDCTTFQSVETMVRGSFGYMDPQYFSTGVFSTKSDVYSYGVVLLELITGHQAIHNATSLVFWAAPHLGHPSCYHHLVDQRLRNRFDEKELESLVELVKLCIKDDLKTRPSMRQVVSYLTSKNLVAVHGDSSEQVPKSDGTISWEDYHKGRPYSFNDSESAAGSTEIYRHPHETIPELHPD